MGFRVHVLPSVMGFLLLKKFFDSDAPGRVRRAARIRRCTSEPSNTTILLAAPEASLGEDAIPNWTGLRTSDGNIENAPKQRKQKVFRELETAFV